MITKRILLFTYVSLFFSIAIVAFALANKIAENIHIITALNNWISLGIILFFAWVGMVLSVFCTIILIIERKEREKKVLIIDDILRTVYHAEYIDDRVNEPTIILHEIVFEMKDGLSWKLSFGDEPDEKKSPVLTLVKPNKPR